MNIFSNLYSCFFSSVCQFISFPSHFLCTMCFIELFLLYKVCNSVWHCNVYSSIQRLGWLPFVFFFYLFIGLIINIIAVVCGDTRATLLSARRCQWMIVESMLMAALAKVCWRQWESDPKIKFKVIFLYKLKNYNNKVI